MSSPRIIADEDYDARSDPPERDEIFCAECVTCRLPANPDECDEKGNCSNCCDKVDSVPQSL